MVSSTSNLRSRGPEPKKKQRLGRLLVGIVCVFTLFANPAAGEQLRLQFAWGGTTPVQWRGRIAIEGGRLSDPRYLGDETDVVESVGILANAIRIQAKSPRTYQAIEVTVEADLSARILVEFAMDGSQSPTVHELKFEDILDGSFNQPLDEADSRLLIRRVPGDRLRIATVNGHLVFSPKQRWVVDVVPHRTGLSRLKKARLQVRVVRSGSEQVIWKMDRSMVRDESAEFLPATAVQVPIPEQEGVYDLVTRLGPTRNLNLLNGNSSIERRVQFVVVDESHFKRPRELSNWHRAFSFDPAEPKWWERLGRLPRLEQLAINPLRLRGKGSAQTDSLDGVRVIRLDAGTWQVYPLPVSQIGEPHMLEVEYPAGAPQSLGVSLVEPKLDGSADLSLRDNVVRVGELTRDETNRVHRMVFWPRTATPCVWLTNLSYESPAYFGRIQLWDSPRKLPPPPNQRSQTGNRVAFAHLDQPDFLERFAAPGASDRDSERTLSDWQSFDTAGDRLVQYLKNSGFSGLQLVCYGDGGAILPMPAAGITSRYDTGVYFGNGQDLYRKDVVELLLRKFSRDNLKMMVGLRFDAALENLESQLSDPQAPSPHSTGIRLSPTESEVPEVPRYNLLDPRVQAEITRLVRYVIDRYSHHRSFAGIQFQLDSDATGHLGSIYGGTDSTTIQRFREQRRLEIEPIVGNQFSKEMLTTGSLAHLWNQWRTDEIARFYQELVRLTKRTRLDAELMLDVSQLVHSPVVRASCQPALPRQHRVPHALISLGLDLQKLTNVGVIVNQPRVFDSLESLVNGHYETWSNDESWSQLARSCRNSSALVRIKPFLNDTASIQANRIFDDAPIAANRYVATGENVTLQRMTAALIHCDVATVMVGGEQLPCLLSDPAQNWLHSFQQIPAGKFRSLETTTGSPVLVRHLQHAGRTYIYALNNSPWKIRTAVEFRAKPNCQFGSLDRDTSGSTWNRPERGSEPQDSATWECELEPFGLSVGFLTDPDAQPSKAVSTLPEEVLPLLQKRYTEVAARLNGLKRPEAYEVIANAGFDAAPEPLGVPGWNWPQQPHTTVKRDNQVFHSGLASLQIESKQPVMWVRSDPIPVPETGRMAVKAMIKFATEQPSAPLRIALEGIHEGRTYYRYAQVLPPTATPPATGATAPLPAQQWMPFMLQVNDLPADGLEQLRVRFDLMGPGKVWVDDLNMFSLAFSADEQMQLSRIVSLADYQLREGDLAGCARTLDQYWPRYLLRFGRPEVPRMADVPKAAEPITPRSQNPGFLGRVRELIPSILR